MSKKRKHDNHKDKDQPYIKKPLNAFMLYRKEQRAKVVAELNISNNAAVNKVLGVRWRALPKEEQDKYYEKADKERLLHSQRHPNWSSKDNYGKTKKKNKGKDHTSFEESASAGVMEPSISQTVLMQPPHAQTAMTGLCETSVNRYAASTGQTLQQQHPQRTSVPAERQMMTTEQLEPRRLAAPPQMSASLQYRYL